MTDTALNYFHGSGTTAERTAFTPSPPTVASGPDMLYLFFDTDLNTTYYWTGAAWAALVKKGAEVAGPASSTDNAIVRFDGTSGELIQDSAITVSDTGAITFPDNIRQTFNPGADAAGINVGSIAGDPGTPTNGDLWYDSTANELTARINGANVALGAGGGGVSDGDKGDIVVSGSGATYTLDMPLTPGGRLTLTSATPVLTADTTAAGTVYYTPYVNARVPIYDGTNWAMKAFTERTLTLNSTDNLIENLYDVWIFNNAGTLTLGTGPAWTNTATITVTIASPAVVTWTGHGLPEGAPVIFTTSGALPTGITAGTTYYVGRSPAANTFNISTSVANAAAGTFVNTSGSQSGTHTGTNHTTTRGTGAGTTELELKDGIWTNKVSITLKGGGSTVGTPGANQATYLGTIYTTANGQTSWKLLPAAASGGAAPIAGVYNAYNRIPVDLRNIDNGSWSYGTATYRAANNSTSNRVTWVDGLRTSMPKCSVAIRVVDTNVAGGSTGLVFDSTTATPSETAEVNGWTQTTGPYHTLSAGAVSYPLLGLHYVQGVESYNPSVSIANLYVHCQLEM